MDAKWLKRCREEAAAAVLESMQLKQKLEEQLEVMRKQVLLANMNNMHTHTHTYTHTHTTRHITRTIKHTTVKPNTQTHKSGNTCE